MPIPCHLDLVYPTIVINFSASSGPRDGACRPDISRLLPVASLARLLELQTAVSRAPQCVVNLKISAGSAPIQLAPPKLCPLWFGQRGARQTSGLQDSIKFQLFSDHQSSLPLLGTIDDGMSFLLPSIRRPMVGKNQQSRYQPCILKMPVNPSTEQHLRHL